MALKDGEHNVCVIMDDEDYQALKAIAEENHRTVSGQVRFWLKNSVKLRKMKMKREEKKLNAVSR